jgi:hypothetical protein
MEIPELELPEAEEEPGETAEATGPGEVMLEAAPEPGFETEPEAPGPGGGSPAEPELLESLEEIEALPPEETEEPEGDVRSEMRAYLDGVRQRLEATDSEPEALEAAAPPTPRPAAIGPAASTPAPGAPAPVSTTQSAPGTGALLDYLAKLSDYLPERERTRFQASDVRLSLERIRARLAGARGLAKTIEERWHPPVATGPLTRPLLFDALRYLRGLAAAHPDRTVGEALAKRIEGVILRIGGAG